MTPQAAAEHRARAAWAALPKPMQATLRQMEPGREYTADDLRTLAGEIGNLTEMSKNRLIASSRNKRILVFRLAPLGECLRRFGMPRAPGFPRATAGMAGFPGQDSGRASRAVSGAENGGVV